MTKSTMIDKSAIVAKSKNKYMRSIRSVVDGSRIVVDVYCVLVAFRVHCPARAHAAKKILCAGLRGKASAYQDLVEARVALDRAIQEAEFDHEETNQEALTHCTAPAAATFCTELSFITSCGE